MSLDTEVKGDPATLTAVCDWANKQSTGAEQAGSQVLGARNDSESGWQHEAAEGFRSVMTTAGKMIDTEVELLQSTCRAANTRRRSHHRETQDAGRQGRSAGRWLDH